MSSPLSQEDIDLQVLSNFVENNLSNNGLVQRKMRSVIADMKASLVSMKSSKAAATTTTTTTSSSTATKISSMPSSSSSSISATGIQRITTNNLWPSNSREALYLVLHSFMLDEGFICIVELKSTVPGFAPPVREMPKDKLIPDGWNGDLSSFSFMYKHVVKPGKQFSLTCVQVSNDLVMMTLSERSGDSFSTEISIQNYVNESKLNISSEERDLNIIYDNMDELKTKIKSMVYQLCPKLKPSDPLSSSSQQSNESFPGPVPTFQPRGDPYPYNPYPHRPEIPVIGGGDLHPFPGLIDPFPGSGLYPRGDGNLMGPNHPFFDPNGSQGILPQPRFDPFLPPTGPHGPNVGPFGGRGRGRGRPAPGEPNPDHLRPPNDFNDNFFT